MINRKFKVLSITMAAVMLMSVGAACTTVSTDASSSVPSETSIISGYSLVGGWTCPTSYRIDSYLKHVFEKGIMTGSDHSFKPALLLATKSSTGTDYCFLAVKTGATSSDKTYALIYINAAAKASNVTLLKTEPIALAGSWFYPDSCEVTEDIDYITKGATLEFMGSEYEAVAFLATRPASSNDFAVICKVIPNVEKAVCAYQVVIFNEDYSGLSTVGECQELNIGV